MEFATSGEAEKADRGRGYVSLHGFMLLSFILTGGTKIRGRFDDSGGGTVTKSVCISLIHSYKRLEELIASSILETPSPELYDPFYQSRPRSARPLGFESLPEPGESSLFLLSRDKSKTELRKRVTYIEDLVDETCNHPEYPSDLDFTHSQDQRDEFEFSVEAAIEDVEVTGTSIARIGSEISKAADMVNVDKLFGLREELENKLENYKRELNRLHNKVKIVGGSVQTVRM
jgi:uncharacterized protein with HEPN domain